MMPHDDNTQVYKIYINYRMCGSYYNSKEFFLYYIYYVHNFFEDI